MRKRVDTSNEGSLHHLRGPATRRLLALDERQELTTAHVRLLSTCMGISERTLWRWVRAGREEGRTERKPHPRFVLTEDLRVRLALLGGNVARLHRELTAEADGALVPGLSTLYRAADRDLGAGIRAGFRKGEQARRAFDVWLQRPKGAGHEDESHRNRVGEGDHKQLSIELEVEGRLCKPWVTWFIDCATCAICGLAVTSG
ncbi:hypothetical protein AB0C33_14945 [Nonomuraea sp. NPDC048881]|uniref:hypothetical protein n=1 Tax=Nonomuraea sp. NPDC048881 TaxID=3155030 RepID=UPI0033D3FB2E